ncbi:ABCC1 [Symbiodinium natans]|uniref:ABCC1 protein n=1 Tax=Symbiodinium natans TaxID=878477 RepID=A0A812I6G6_9DINO|nr:ABCC1 [Symbiodinium natans]
MEPKLEEVKDQEDVHGAAAGPATGTASPDPEDPRDENEAERVPENGSGYPATGLEEDEVADEATKQDEVVLRNRRGLPPPVPPKVPSLDELSNDMDVPSELPTSVQPEEAESVPLSSIRELVEQRRVNTALKRLEEGRGPGTEHGAARSYGAEGRLLRLRCLASMRRYAEAAEECKQMGDEAACFEVKFFLAQLPWLLHADAYQTMLQLKALAQSWPSDGPAKDRLELLQVLSHSSLTVGHGRMAAEELQRAVSEREDCRELWSLLGRHHLSGGNLPAADVAFAKAQTASGQDSTVLLNSGLRAMSLGDFQAARDAFEAAATALHADKDARLQEVLAAENNLAVCKFYTKDLRGACERLKALVLKDPVRFLVPCLLQNLASLYEFAQDAASQRKALRDLAGAAQLEDLEPRLFQSPQS